MTLGSRLDVAGLSWAGGQYASHGKKRRQLTVFALKLSKKENHNVYLIYFRPLLKAGRKQLSANIVAERKNKTIYVIFLRRSRWLVHIVYTINHKGQSNFGKEINFVFLCLN